MFCFFKSKFSCCSIEICFIIDIVGHRLDLDVVTKRQLTDDGIYLFQISDLESEAVRRSKSFRSGRSRREILIFWVDTDLRRLYIFVSYSSLCHN